MCAGRYTPRAGKRFAPHTLAHIYEHATEEELAALTPDTIVPGYLLVVAQEPLEGKWYLRGTPLDNAFEWQDYTEFYIENELKAELAARYAEHNGQEILCTGVLFNAPIALEHAAEIFPHHGDMLQRRKSTEYGG